MLRKIEKSGKNVEEALALAAQELGVSVDEVGYEVTQEIGKGLMGFLQLEKWQFGRMNLREVLMSYGCTEGEVVYKTKNGSEIRLPCWKKQDDEELLSMDAFYEDIYDGDTDILQKTRLNKEEKGNDDGNDPKF